MVNTMLLDEKINQSGLKVDFLISNLGISPTAFYKKKRNEIPFRTAEVYVLCDLLGINTEQDKLKVFFEEKV